MIMGTNLEKRLGISSRGMIVPMTDRECLTGFPQGYRKKPLPTQVCFDFPHIHTLSNNNRDIFFKTYNTNL